MAGVVDIYCCRRLEHRCLKNSTIYTYLIVKWLPVNHDMDFQPHRANVSEVWAAAPCELGLRFNIVQYKHIKRLKRIIRFGMLVVIKEKVWAKV